MKKRFVLFSTLLIAALFSFTEIIHAQENSSFEQTFNLGGQRTCEPQFFIQETYYVKYALDGKRTGTDILKMYLSCVPIKQNETTVYKYTCNKFQIKFGDAQWRHIPVLTGWSYLLDDRASGIDEQGQVFGIDHTKFENLKDSQNQAVSQELSYIIYNSFIDFHGFCNVFAEPFEHGNGIQNLTRINQKIVHAAAYSEPPVNLGSNIEKGSFFKNGEVTLEFIGLGYLKNSVCAMINYDSGESSFNMLMKIPPELEIKTVGSSHYKGIIYKNLKTNWVEKVTMDEFVLTETILPFPPNKINAATERTLTVENVSEKRFTEELNIISN